MFIIATIVGMVVSSYMSYKVNPLFVGAITMIILFNLFNYIMKFFNKEPKEETITDDIQN